MVTLPLPRVTSDRDSAYPELHTCKAAAVDLELWAAGFDYCAVILHAERPSPTHPPHPIWQAPHLSADSNTPRPGPPAHASPLLSLSHS